MIGEPTAERIKKEIVSAAAPLEGNGITIEIKGRDLLHGVIREIAITQRGVAEALCPATAAAALQLIA